MAGHTPGPWKFHTEPQPNRCPIVCTGNGLMVAMLSHSIHYADQREMALSNANLIASAPDLLAALKKAVDALERADDSGMPGLRQIIAEASDAIAKAEGRTA